LTEEAVTVAGQFMTITALAQAHAERLHRVSLAFTTQIDLLDEAKQLSSTNTTGFKLRQAADSVVRVSRRAAHAPASQQTLDAG